MKLLVLLFLMASPVLGQLEIPRFFETYEPLYIGAPACSMFFGGQVIRMNDYLLSGGSFGSFGGFNGGGNNRGSSGNRGGNANAFYGESGWGF